MSVIGIEGGGTPGDREGALLVTYSWVAVCIKKKYGETFHDKAILLHLTL